MTTLIGAAAPCSARLTFTQRTVEADFEPITRIQRHYRQNPAGGNATGDQLVLARKKAGMKQKELAKATGYTRQWIGRWERGRAVPPPEVWNKLATVLGRRHID